MQNKRAFEKFYHAHIDKVYRFVFFRVNYNKTLAEDIVSEVFLKALENFASYDSSKSSSAWIMTIAKNHLANYWRDNKLHTIFGLNPDINSGANFSGEEIDTAQNSASKALITQSINYFAKYKNTQEVNSLLSLLNSREREIVTLHYLNGYSYTEVAEMLNSNLSAVKTAAHRALKKLAQNI